MNNNNIQIMVIDFGGQYNQLIARRVRDLGVYAEIFSHTISLEEIKKISPKGIIFTGGPNSVNDTNSPIIDKKIFDLNIPILGICYGAQLITKLNGGEVSSCEKSEYGHTVTNINKESELFNNINDKIITWMSHTEQITKLPNGFSTIASTDNCKNASIQNVEKKIYAVQFHPEVKHTECGNDIFNNFLYNICKAENNWKIEDFLKNSIIELKNKIGDGKVLCALSGGVDSSVVATLLSKAIGKNLTCVFVNHGLLRLNEEKEVCELFDNNNLYPMNFIYVDAHERFLQKLKNVSEPEQKRKIIGNEFIKVFEEEAKKIGEVDFLAQGTIYPDVIESGLNGSSTIKSHHNVGGLPSVVNFKQIIEPLRLLFKDEVRKLGKELSLPMSLVNRQPFPGPGLGIRIIGEVTEDKLNILKQADHIYLEEIKNANLDKNINQYYAALSNMKTVGVMGDFRTYNYALCLRAVVTDDFMTATAYDIPYDVLQKIMTRIVNEVKGINRVFYDLTSKPPGTIEME